jgi:hypothetical protein
MIRAAGQLARPYPVTDGRKFRPINTLGSLGLRYPEVDKARKTGLAAAKRALLASG